MKLITSVKNLFLYSLVLLITVCSLWLTPPSAIAAPVNVQATPQYIVADATTYAQSEIENIEELISELRATKVSIGKDKSLSNDEKKARLQDVNSHINDLIKDRKEIENIEELISELRATKVSIGKDKSLSNDEKKARLQDVNSHINDLIKDKKVLLGTQTN